MAASSGAAAEVEKNVGCSPLRIAIARSETRIARMNVPDQSLFVRDFLQKVGEPPLLLIGQRREQARLMLARDALDGLQRRLPFVRELSALRLMVDGKANKEIATELRISERTVKAHLGHLFEKLGVTSRTEAVKVASRRGLVRLD